MNKFLIFVLIIFLLIGCNKYENMSDNELELEWEKLYSAGGCLTGHEHWNGYKKPEGSVFSEDKWQDFFDITPKTILPFLMERYDSEKLTNIHVCPFGNATEGELAVFVSEYVLESNWFDCAQSYKTLSDWSEKEIYQLTQHMIKDTNARNELINCFTNKME